MKKIIIISFLFICLLTGCHGKPNKQEFDTNLKIDEEIIEINKPASKEIEVLQDEPIVSESNLDTAEQQTKLIESNENNNNQQQEVIASNSEPASDLDDDIVDIESVDYPIHKGRIDCYSEAACMDISIPIQFKYKKSIANVFYLEVLSKKSNILGYFIEYNFKENQYSSYEECHSIGSEIKNTLSDRVISYECSSDGTLKIKTDYGKE